MIISLNTARKRLRNIARVIQQSREELLEVRKSLSPSRRDTSHKDLDADPSPSTEMRAVIDCVLRDSLEPAVQSLIDAASYQPARTRKRKPRAEAPPATP